MKTKTYPTKTTLETGTEEVAEKNTIQLVKELTRELASELDLHYEDDDMVNLQPTISVIQRAEAFLLQEGCPVPNVVIHIKKRFRSHYN